MQPTFACVLAHTESQGLDPTGLYMLHKFIYWFNWLLEKSKRNKFHFRVVVRHTVDISTYFIFDERARSRLTGCNVESFTVTSKTFITAHSFNFGCSVNYFRCSWSHQVSFLATVMSWHAKEITERTCFVFELPCRVDVWPLALLLFALFLKYCKNLRSGTALWVTFAPSLSRRLMFSDFLGSALFLFCLQWLLIPKILTFSKGRSATARSTFAQYQQWHPWEMFQTFSLC